MRRISTPTAVLDLFGPGKPGFTNGDPLAAIPTTDLDAEWFNGAQEELIRVIEAAGLTPDEANLAQLLAAIRILTPGRWIDTRYFTAVGTTVYVPSPGTNRVRVLVHGGGGAGGGAPATGASDVSQGANGSAGSWLIKNLSAGFAGVNITVGAAGSGNLGAAGNDGGASSFGIYVAGGGRGGLVGGPTPSANFVVTSAGLAATPTLGDLNVTGPGPAQCFTAAGQSITSAVAVGAFGFGPGAGGAASPPNSGSMPAREGGAGGGGIVIVGEYT